MRDPNRIDEICNLLRDVWKQYPYKRLGELIADKIGTHNCYYVSDEVLENHLKQSLRLAENKSEEVKECQAGLI